MRYGLILLIFIINSQTLAWAVDSSSTQGYTAPSRPGGFNRPVFLPQDRLYFLEAWREGIVIALNINQSDKAAAELGFSKKRLEELEQELISGNKDLAISVSENYRALLSKASVADQNYSLSVLFNNIAFLRYLVSKHLLLWQVEILNQNLKASTDAYNIVRPQNSCSI